MTILIEFFKLAASLALLLYSADRLVMTASKLAKAVGVSSTVIGITLIGYGTSLPEFAVSSIASVQKHADLSVSNIVGSNIFNIAILAGLAAFFVKMTFKEKTVSRIDIVALVMSALLLSALLLIGGIERAAGAVMILLVATYTMYVIRHDRATNGLVRDKTLSWTGEFAKSIPLLGLVLLSADILVGSSVNIARALGISEWIIGATIIAAGTSMPEFAVTVSSARRGDFGLLLGNIVGSNIFNILWILGFASVLNPLYVSFAKIHIDTAMMILVTALFTVSLLKKSITRFEGGIYIGIYLSYLIYLGHSAGAF